MGYSLRGAGTFTDLWERVSPAVSGYSPVWDGPHGARNAYSDQPLPDHSNFKCTIAAERLQSYSGRRWTHPSCFSTDRTHLVGVARTQAPGTPSFVTPGVSCATTRGERWETMYLVTASLSRTGCETGVDWNGRGTTEGERPAVGRLDLALATGGTPPGLLELHAPRARWRLVLTRRHSRGKQ